MLEARNLIRRNRNISRGIELVNRQGARRSNIISIPVIGSIAAGLPIEFPDQLAESEHVETIEVEPSSRLTTATISSRFAFAGSR